MAKVGRRQSSASLRKLRPATEIRKRLRHPAIAGAPALARPLSIKGRVIESSFRQPLVRAKVTLQDAATPAARILASAITDSRGYFTATLAPLPDGGQPKTITAFARVELISGQQVLPPTEFSLRASVAITLTVQLPQGAATPATWQTISARMRDARLVRLNEVVSGLLDLSPGTNPFEGLDLASRYAAATSARASVRGSYGCPESG